MSMVEAATPADIPFLANCWRAMLDELQMVPSGFHPDWHERLSAHFARGMGAGSQGWFVARAPDKGVIGTAAALISETTLIALAPTAVIAGVYVQPPYRRQGLARALTLAAIDWAQAKNCGQVRLIPSAAAAPLYLSLGFTPGRELVLRLPFDSVNAEPSER